MADISGIRKDYKLKTLNEADVADEPMAQFTQWWQEAVASDILEVNAMALSTVNSSGQPSSRIVLLKDYNSAGFTFYSNYQSSKANDMDTSPHVSLLFFWKELERQIRIEGIAQKADPSVSDAYFASRPFGSKIGAWASPQSSVIDSRDVLEANTKNLEEQYLNSEVDRPPHWGGYVVHPTAIEFWQGRANRLHDRLKYIKENDTWNLSRLAP